MCSEYGAVGALASVRCFHYPHFSDTTQSDYNLVWWIRSEEPATLASDYAALAVPLNLPEEGAQDQTAITSAVTRALAARTGWLLIFDNAENPGQIEPYLPQTASGHVLITSRNQAFGGIASGLQVEELPPDESVELLLKRSGREKTATPADRADAARLAEELGYLPLALNQAAAYIEATGATFGNYLNLFKSKQKDRLADGRNLRQDERTIAGTWDLSIQKVEKESPAALQLLNLCAFFAPDDIPRAMLQAGAEHLPKPLSQAVADESQWYDATAALRRYSLAEVSADAETGRGLALVANLPADWGAYRTPAGKVVCFTLALQDPHHGL